MASSMSAVCSPRVTDCRRNIAYVRLAMKLATSSESGVMSTTSSVIGALNVSMKPSVPRIVITPEKSWVKPISRPSANVSTSAIMRLTVSPVGCASR